jgi:hypothetical protein
VPIGDAEVLVTSIEEGAGAVVALAGSQSTLWVPTVSN